MIPSGNGFKGTLLLLQNHTKRNPDCYREEFKSQLDHFDAITKSSLVAQVHTNPQFLGVMNYVCNTGHCFPKECKHVPAQLIRILQATKTTMDSDTRMAIVKNLALLRSRNLVSPDVTLPIFFELLQLREKGLRQVILAHIVGDVRKANMPTAKNGPAVNKKAQNFLFKVMADDDPVQARCALLVMIDLYRRDVWADQRTVEVLSQACFSHHTQILRTALRFFLMQMPKISSVDDTDDEVEADPGREISKIKQKLKIVKKTKKRERVLDRNVKSARKRYDKEKKAEDQLAKQCVDPIRLLRDPQQFTEKLLQKLQKTTERFEVRILFLNVIARVIAEHRVVVLPLYSFLERYMEPSQLHSTQLLALSAVCVHDMVPPDAVEPLIRAIANHFVSDRSTPDAITIGINTIREMCKRQPLAMSKQLLADLVEYKSQRGDNGVVMAARALIQLYREVQPSLLPTKLQGSRLGPAGPKAPLMFGTQSPLHDIPGMELLLAHTGETVDDAPAAEDGKSDSSSSDSSDGEYELFSHDSSDEEDSDDDDGFIDVIHSSDDDGDDCPQLVPVAASSAMKSTGRGGSTSVAVAEDPDIWRDDDDDAAPGAISAGPSTTRRAAPGPVTKKARTEVAAARHTAEDDDDDDDDGEWEVVDDDEESDGDDEESDDGEWEEVSEDEAEEDEEEGDGNRPSTISKPKKGSAAAPAAASSAPIRPSASGNEEWLEDVDGMSSKAPSVAAPRSVSHATTGKSTTSLAAVRILTDEDFEKIRRLQQGGGTSMSLKQRDKEARLKKREQLVHGVSADLAAHDIEQFTEKKRTTDKEDKILKTQELRSAASKFEARKKKKSKLHSTHGEHAKRGKLFQMTKRSARVAEKLKRSVEDRADRKKDMKKKDIKFRINRGWKT